MRAKTLLSGALMAIALTAPAGCGKKVVEIIDIHMAESVAIEVGEKYRMMVFLTPPDTTDKLKWIVGDPYVLSIDQATGEITGLELGTSMIVAQAGGKSATCVVTVEPDILPLLPQPIGNMALLGGDKNGNGMLSPSEAATVPQIGLIEVEIPSLETLHYFTGLVSLGLVNCIIPQIELPNLPHLERLDLTGCRLEELDVSMLPSLWSLNCPGNLLTGIDVSNNRNLRTLTVSGNPGRDGVFAVRAWFDDGNVPNGFPTGSWEYDGQTVTIDYQKVD